jgi:glycosyltransferase involved in cell wall biosynthesis
MIQKSDIWVCLPSYNEGQIIISVIDGIRSEGYTKILVIDDGSSDNTQDILSTLNIKYLRLPINRGVGAAIQLAIEYAVLNEFKYLAFMDADGQHVASCLPNLVKIMEKEHADIVIGHRFIYKDNKIPSKRIFYNYIANKFTSIFTKHTNDSQSGYRLLNRKSIEKLNLTIDGYGVCSEMIMTAKKANLHIANAPIKVFYTDYSLSKGQNLRKGILTALSIFKTKFKI